MGALDEASAAKVMFLGRAPAARPWTAAPEAEVEILGAARAVGRLEAKRARRIDLRAIVAMVREGSEVG